MAIDPQFMQALQMIGQAGQQFAIGQQMNAINDRAQAIRDSIMPDMEKRQAMQQLAQMSSVSVAGSGGSTQQLASLQNLIPQTPNNAIQAILQGQLNGDQQMVQVGTEILQREDARELRKYQMQLDRQLQAQAQQAGLMEQRDIKKLNAKELGDVKGLETTAQQSLAKLTKAKALIQGSNLIGTGPIDQFLAFTPHAKRIEQALADVELTKVMEMAERSGAKTVDTEGERAVIRKGLPSMGQYESNNIKIIDEQISALRSIIQKSRASQEAYKVSGGMTLDAASLGLGSAGSSVTQGKYRPQGRPNSNLSFFGPKGN